MEGAVGNTGLVTLIMGELIRAAEPRYRDERHRELVLMARLRTPSEVLVFDLLVHSELFGHLRPSLVLHSDLFAEELLSQPQACDQIAVEESVECLGTGIAGIRATDIPRYQDMISYVFNRLGWDAEQLEVHRVRMAYPMIPTSVRLVHQLPPAPPDDRWTERRGKAIPAHD